MKRLLCPELPTETRAVSLPENEAEHATRVLRLRDGDEVIAMNGKGQSVLATLRTKGGIRIEFLRSIEADSEAKPLPITLEMAILKGDAMEWVIEKAVELGVRKLVPVITDHTVVQIRQKGPEAFQTRWQKIADQALKQCGRLSRLEITSPVELKMLVAEKMPESSARLWCDEKARDQLGSDAHSASLILKAPEAQEYHLLIGPEGGWSQEERRLLSQASGTRVIDLGPLVLRAETAAIFGISALVARLQIK